MFARHGQGIQCQNKRLGRYLFKQSVKPGYGHKKHTRGTGEEWVVSREHCRVANVIGTINNDTYIPMDLLV